MSRESKAGVRATAPASLLAIRKRRVSRARARRIAAGALVTRRIVKGVKRRRKRRVARRN